MSAPTEKLPKEKLFTGYQVFIIAILAFIQFTIILDFMVLSPLGPILRPALKMSPQQFSFVVSAYAFSAGLSGLLAAGFADRFDRKKMLLFFYAGFVIGTFLCGIATNYHFLLGARIVTGIFGGVIGSIGFAIITDLFKMEVRGTVMGFVQTAFAASQVLGLPIGIFLAPRLGWHSPFLMIVGLCIVAGVLIVVYMKPVTAHLEIQTKRNPFQHLGKTLSQSRYLRAFAATTLLATGGFMLMPFGADFGVHNLGLTGKNDLFWLYMISGLFAMVTGPLMGKYSDRIGKYKLFVIGSILSFIMVNLYCNLSVTPLWGVIAINVIMFMGISARMISSGAMMTAIPDPQDRGAFMSLNSSIQSLSGGIAAIVAGMIVIQHGDAPFERYDILGYLVAVSIVITIIMMYPIHRYILNNQTLVNKQPKDMPKNPLKTEEPVAPVSAE
jgi:predicted MFS family arabinose efflux permease